jgi:glyoxylase-like metal-dependent hydrolase (beta-lactamase superfamily II)
MFAATRYSTLALCFLLFACTPEAPEESAVVATAPATPSTPSTQTAAVADQSVGTVSAGDGIDNRGSSAESTKWWQDLPRPEWASYELVQTSHPWFEVHKIRPDIYAIYEPGQFEEVISWLIIGGKQALLFDTGLGMGDIRGVVAELTSLPLTVLNSHGHYDHVGGNYQFDTIIGRNLPYSKEKAMGRSHEEVAEFASDKWIRKQHPPNFDPATYRSKPYQFSSWIDEGEFVDLGGVSLEVFRAPGHAPDGIVLVDHKRRLMFTGDVFYPAPLYAHLEGSSVEDYASTAERLAAMTADVDYLLPSHNLPIISSSYLAQLDTAFKSIIAGTASYEISDGAREYPFQGFSVLTIDPPLTAPAEMDQP